MASTHSLTETNSIGLEGEACKSLSGMEAMSLLRVLAFQDDQDDRIQTAVSIFPIADGRSLYMHSPMN